MPRILAGPTSSRRSLTFSVSALLIAATAAPGQLATRTELAGHSLAGYPFFSYVQTFDDGGPIQLALDPTRFATVAGTECDVYVAVPKSDRDWSSDPLLADVRAQGPQTVVLGPNIQDNTFVVADSDELDAVPALGLGVGYDLVLDCDRDGLLDGGDFLDGGAEAGFYRVRDPTQPGRLAVSVAEYSGGTWLGQRTFFPTAITGLGQLPLVVVGHGWTHGYNFYDHIGTHLASYGYVVMAFTNEVGNGASQATRTAAVTTLTNTDYLLSHQATIAGGVLNGHIDPHRIVWIGHSTGGEAVVRALTRLRTGDFVPDRYSLDDIRLVSSIAPVSFLTPAEVTPGETAYHMFVGAADTDASGQPTNGYFQSMAIYERGSGDKHLVYVQGAGHNDFHAADQPPYAFGPDLIGKQATNTLVKGYYLALVELYTRDNPAARDFLVRMYDDFHPTGIPTDVVIALDAKDGEAGGNFVIDDFQTEPDLATSSSGGAVSFDVADVAEVLMRDQDGSFAWTGAQPSNGMTRYRMPGDDPRCVVFEWSPGAPRFYELEVVPSERDFSDNSFLTFRVAQGTRHPETDALDAPLTFTVALRDGSGATSSIDVGNYGAVTRTYQRTGFGPGAGWGNEFNTVRLRLSDFLADGSGLDLSDTVAVRFEFGIGRGSQQGRLALDDVQVTTPEAPMPPPLEIDFPDGIPSVLVPDQPTVIPVTIASDDLVPGSEQLLYRFGGGDYLGVPLAAVADGLYEATLPAAPCGQQAELYFQAEGTAAGVVSQPPSAPAAVFAAPVANRVRWFEETLDRDPGWPREGQWSFGMPAGGGGAQFGHPDPSGGATGDNVFGVALAGDYATGIGGPFYLTLGPVDLSAVAGSRLVFERWLNTEIEPWIETSVEISADGSAWTEIWSTWQAPFAGESVFAESSWTPVDLDISSFADDQPSVWVRWGYKVVLPAFPAAGWNLDDVSILGHSCSTVGFDVIFADGFESGDTSEWR